MESRARAEWVRRAGPLYPVLVAYKRQTNTRILLELQPSPEDIHRSGPWLLAVGLSAGLLSLVCSFAFVSYPGSPIAAAMAVAIGFLPGAGFYEAGLAKATAWALGLKGEESGRVAQPSAIMFALLIPFAALSTLPRELWIGAILSAHIACRWSYLFAFLQTDWRRDLQLGNPPRWMSFAIGSVAAFAVIVTLGGARGFCAILLAGLLAALASSLTKKQPDLRVSFAAAAGCLAFISAFLCFCL